MRQAVRVALPIAFALASGCGPSAPGEPAPTDTPFEAPRSLTAAASSATSITLSWTGTANNDVASAIEVERALFTDGPYELVATAPGNATSHDDPALLPDVAYWYRVRATRDAETSAWAGPVRQVLPPNTPTELQTNVVSDVLVVLTWTNASNVADGFLIERRVGAAAFQELTQTEEPGFLDESVVGESNYEYRVSAFNDGGQSAFATATALTPIASPTDLDSETPSSTELVLTWIDHSDIEAGYHVAAAQDPGGPWTGFNVAANSTSAMIDGLTPGSTAYWRVNAYTTEGEASGFAGPLQVTMPP